mgnify:FL=1
MATLKHINSKNADYGAAEQYLLFEHDEFTMKPVLDETGRLIPREDYRLSTLNCGGDDFAVACMRANLRYEKNQRREDVKSHHYIISFAPRDGPDNGLTVDRVQELGEQFCKEHFPGHQVLVCTHPDGHNHSGNIHVHIVINSLRIEEVPFLPYMDRPVDTKAGCKHRCTDLQRILKYLNTVYLKIQSAVYAGRYETFKLMHIGKGILVVAVFFLIIGFSFNTNTLVFSPEETFLNDYYEKYGGKLSSAVYDSIDKMQSESQAVEKEFNVKSKQFAEGEISFEEYELALAKNDAYDTQRKAVEVLREQVGRIEVLKEKGIEPVLINEAGYNSLFSPLSNQSELLLLLCAVIIIFSSAFSIEKASNMLSLNHCAKNGRQNLYFKKILCVIPKTFALTLISYLSMILQINYFYKIEYLSADIHNLQILQNVDIEVSILEYLIINFLFEFLFVTAAAFITVSLSSFMPQMAVIIISAGLFVLPGALNMADIDFAKEVSASFMFNFNSFVLDKGLSAYSFAVHFILIIVCAAMFYMSNRRWCLTKDR